LPECQKFDGKTVEKHLGSFRQYVKNNKILIDIYVVLYYVHVWLITERNRLRLPTEILFYTNTYTVSGDYILYRIVTLHCSLFYWIQPVQPEISIFSRMNTYDVFVGRRRIRVGSRINFHVRRAVNNFRFLEAFVYYIMSVVVCVFIGSSATTKYCTPSHRST